MTTFSDLLIYMIHLNDMSIYEKLYLFMTIDNKYTSIRLISDMPSLPVFPVDYRFFTSSTGLPVFGKKFFHFICKICTGERTISTFR